MWPIAAAIALVVGLVWLDRRVSTKPSPASPPPGASITTPITDAPTVRYYQGLLADMLSKLTQEDIANFPTPLAINMWTAGEVDGNPQNPRWVAALSAIQIGANAEANGPDLANPGKKRGWPTDFPADFPAQLRTDGVLDYATAMLLNNG